MIEMKRFESHDWDAFCGATSFDDGSDPLISVNEVYIDNVAFLVVVDKEGLQLMDIDGNCYSVKSDEAMNVLFELEQNVPLSKIQNWIELGVMIH